MDRGQWICVIRLRAAVAAGFVFLGLAAAGQQQNAGDRLSIAIEPAHGAYSIAQMGGSLNGAAIAAEVDHRWLRAADYPKPSIAESTEADEQGRGHGWTVTYSGAPGRPDLIYRLRAPLAGSEAFIEVTVRNGTAQPITVQDIRPIEIVERRGIRLGSEESNWRVLSDSMSEDRPTMRIRDLADAPGGVHRAAGSQLFFDRTTHRSLFIGALTSGKFLTLFKAHVSSAGGAPAIAAYEVDDTGTTEYEEEWSLRDAPAQDQMELSVTIEPGQEIKSERLLLSFSDDYHHQLETYARMIRDLHHARVTAPTPMGWWSWTAYYAKLDEKTALADAQWLAQNLQPLGYEFFHIDEGYSIGRGDYLAPDRNLFPNGMEPLEKKIAALGLTPAIWTAPFEVSELSWVYKNHPEWLVKNADGKPIVLTGATPPNPGRIFALDPTHPGAQEYLRTTYSTMAGQWGIRYFKLDFMEDSAIEGRHYRANTSALEAQRIGLQVIRSAVGDKVWLDKDGSPMLNPVGLLDMGRISQDTGHDFKTVKDAATGIAARYYMNRNYFIADPDAFMVTTGTGKRVLSFDEAKVSIALSAISGGMFEIGDKLPEFASEPDRLALLKNPTLLAMAKRGEASKPIDLMSYAPEDGQPSVFFLKTENDVNSGILTIFNWTDRKRTHIIHADELGLPSRGMGYSFLDVFTGGRGNCSDCAAIVNAEPHSVTMLKITGFASAGAK